jgi:adenylate cyclase
VHDARGESRRLTAAQVAREASAPEAYVRELVDAGMLAAGADGLHGPDDVSRVRLAHELAPGGIGIDDLQWLIDEGKLQLIDIPRMGPDSEPSGRTFAGFRADLGDKGELLPAIYAAFGLGLPAPDALMQVSEEEAIRGFLDVWAMVDDRPEVYLRAARIAGEGIRHLQLGTIDLFEELGGSPPSRLKRGMPRRQAVAPSVRMAEVMDRLIVWLFTRHSEHEIYSRIVAYIEGGLAGAGRMPARVQEPNAIAFVDLTGYTERTAAAGDELAARVATTLQVIAQSVSAAHGGRVIKLLGDGVMLRFGSPVTAVAAVRELLGRIADAELPQAHAGIAAGPFVVRDGDVYGHTVNVAARVASAAASGELLVTADIAERLADAGVALEDAGEFRLKGIAEPLRLVRVTLEPLSSTA